MGSYWFIVHQLSSVISVGLISTKYNKHIYMTDLPTTDEQRKKYINPCHWTTKHPKHTSNIKPPNICHPQTKWPAQSSFHVPSFEVKIKSNKNIGLSKNILFHYQIMYNVCTNAKHGLNAAYFTVHLLLIYLAPN